MSGRPLHVQVNAIVICTRSRPQIGHVPFAERVMAACSGQLHTDSSRTGTSIIRQSGHVPGCSSMTSGCIGHVCRTGGNAALAADARGAVGTGAWATAHTTAVSTRMAAARIVCDRMRRAIMVDGTSLRAILLVGLILQLGRPSVPVGRALEGVRGAQDRRFVEGATEQLEADRQRTGKAARDADPWEADEVGADGKDVV